MDFEATRPSAEDPLLIYSLAEFRELILRSFEIAGVKSVVEIGNEEGHFTGHLLEWVASRDGQVVSIDPAPGPRVEALAGESDRLRLVRAMSHDALRDLPPMDAYLIDGDHNYFTVSGELQAITSTCERAGTHPLLLVQDVGWPSGRRDFYYDPTAIPADHLHEHSFEAVVPWSDGTVVDGGFRGNGQMAEAAHEGGPRNGVFTALEDFLAADGSYRVVAVPCVFGLAAVFPSAAGWAEELVDFLSRYDDPLLARMEANRVRLYIEVLRLNDLLSSEKRRHASVEIRLGREMDDIRARAAIAEQAAREAIAARVELEQEVASLRSSSSQGDTAGGRTRMSPQRLLGRLRP